MDERFRRTLIFVDSSLIDLGGTGAVYVKMM
jgi:hypothetical protein